MYEQTNKLISQTLWFQILGDVPEAYFLSGTGADKGNILSLQEHDVHSITTNRLQRFPGILKSEWELRVTIACKKLHWDTGQFRTIFK